MLVLTGIACRRESQVPPQASTPPPPPKTPFVFPTEERVEDPGINAFVERAMSACAEGDYDAFRLLWTARKEPLPRKEFESGWKAVQEIRVRALDQVRLASEDDPAGREGPTVYVLYADIDLDPAQQAGQRKPHRTVVALVVREHDTWKLAKAPKVVREWVKQKVQSETDAATAGEVPPAAQLPSSE